MRRIPGPWRVPCLALVVLASACGGGGGSSAPPAPDWYVDALLGSDAGAGTASSPFQSITHAMSVAVAGDVVQVRPGVYDVNNLEVFPIVVGAGVTLLGDETTKGAGPGLTVIAGNGVVPTDNLAQRIRAAVFLMGGAVVAGFTITNPSPASGGYPNGVVLAHPGFSVRNNTISDCTEYGVYAYQDAGSGSIAGNVVEGNLWGLTFHYPGDGIRVERNEVRGNSTAVQVESETTLVDFGGGAAGSVGQNVFACNDDAAFYVTLGGIRAENCFWDHAPPTRSPDGNWGADIVMDPALSFFTTGAALAPAGCP